VIYIMNIKKLYSTGAIIIICTIIAPIQAASAAPTISVEPSYLSVSQGDNFTVDVTIYPDGTEIYGAEYKLYFNNILLRVLSQNNGSFLSQGGASTVNIANKIDNPAGRIEYGEMRKDVADGVTTSGTLTTIKFEAIRSGSGELRLYDVVLSDPDAQEIPGVIVNNATVELAQPPTPFLISGYVSCKDGSECDDPSVNITNLNTSEGWEARTSADSNYYQIVRANGADLNESEKLQFNVTNGTVSSVANHAITADDVNNGGLFGFNLTLESTGDPAPYLVACTITNTTISPNGDGIMDDTKIHVKFSEFVAATIKIENATGVIKMLYTSSNVKNPNPKIWDGTDDGGNIVADGTYHVNVTMDDGVNPTVYDNSRSIRVANMSVTTIGNASGNVTVPITIKNAANIGSAHINITYNASVCMITDVTNGTFDCTFANLEHNETGWASIGAFQTDNPGLNGSVILANVTFRSNSTNGTSPLNISVVTFTDATPQCNKIPYITQNGTYTVALNGDVNGDGNVTIADAMYLAKHVLGITGFEVIIVGAADVNGDGVINIADAMYLAKHVLGKSGFEELR